jgi:hypothetical protein
MNNMNEPEYITPRQVTYSKNLLQIISVPLLICALVSHHDGLHLKDEANRALLSEHDGNGHKFRIKTDLDSMVTDVQLIQ